MTYVNFELFFKFEHKGWMFNIYSLYKKYYVIN